MLVLEEAVIPYNSKILKLQKTIKMILDNEIARKLQMGQEALENMRGVADSCNELQAQTGKRLKYYRDLI